MSLIIHWIVTAIAVFVATKLVPGISFDDLPSLAFFSIALGLVNAVIKPILSMLALPVVLLTLGLAVLLINALMFGLAAWLVPGFHVDGFLPALLGSLVVSLVSWAIGLVLPKK